MSCIERAKIGASGLLLAGLPVSWRYVAAIRGLYYNFNVLKDVLVGVRRQTGGF